MSFRTLESPILGLHDIESNSVLTARFRDPKYPDGFIFKAKRLPKAVDPPTVLAPDNRPTDYRPQIGKPNNFWACVFLFNYIFFQFQVLQEMFRMHHLIDPDTEWLTIIQIRINRMPFHRHKIIITVSTNSYNFYRAFTIMNKMLRRILVGL